MSVRPSAVEAPPRPARPVPDQPSLPTPAEPARDVPPAPAPGGHPEPAPGFHIANHPVPRLDGEAKVTGRAQFAGDVVLPRMAHAAVVRSPVAHARIRSIDISAALARPGVIGVLTGDDIKRLPNPRFGHAIADHPVLAIDKVRFAGEPVAAVIAVDERTAQQAVWDVEVEYDELPALMDVESAMAPDAPLIHEESYAAGSFGGIYLGDKDEGPVQPRNTCHHTRLERGDVDAAFAAAAHVVEGTYRFPRVYGYAMEPYVAVADYTSNGLTLHTCAQHPYLVRNEVANVFGLPLARVRLIVPYIGGGYGTKSYTKIEPLVAACSWKVGRPVKLQLGVDEAILTTRIAAAVMHCKTAIDDKGMILAKAATLYFDSGAFAENSPHGAHLSPLSFVGPYGVPNVRIDSYVVYTNSCPASSFRGFSSTQPTFAAESQHDEVAEMAGIDALEFRLRNAIGKGEHVNDPSSRPLDGDMKQALAKTGEAIGWGTTAADGRGRGVAVMILAAGAFPVSTAEVRVHSDGSVSVLTGTTELGQGSETVFAQIAAEEFGVPMSKVRVVRSDTSSTPFERSTGASRSTTVQGRAILAACADARERLKTMAAEAFGIPRDEIEVERAALRHGDQSWAWGEIIDAYFGMRAVEVVGTGHVRKAGDLSAWPVFWEMSALGIEVSVDRDTGVVRVEQMASVSDVGFAINPALVEGQDLGAAVQGMGPALFEELRYDGEQLANGSLLLYRIPRFSDVPRSPRMSLVQNRDGVGPYGAKGGGEGTISPMAPAIANAVQRAIGVRLRTVPLTPERVWRALQEAEAGREPST